MEGSGEMSAQVDLRGGHLDSDFGRVSKVQEDRNTDSTEDECEEDEKVKKQNK